MAALIEAIAAVGEVARVAAVPAEVAALPAEAAAIPAEIAALDSVEMAAAKAAPKISTWKKVSTWMGDHYNVVVPMSLVGVCIPKAKASCDAFQCLRKRLLLPLLMPFVW